MRAEAEKKQWAKDAKKSGKKPDQKAVAKAAEDADTADGAASDKAAEQQDDAAAPAEKAEDAAGTGAKADAAGNTAALTQHVLGLQCSSVHSYEMRGHVLAVPHVSLHSTGHQAMHAAPWPSSPSTLHTGQR